MDPLQIEDPTTSNRRRGRCYGASLCVRVVTWVILSCFVVLMLMVSIVWHVTKLDELVFHVDKIGVSNFTVSGSELEGNYDIRLTIKNPNEKVKVRLDRFSVMVCNGEARLAEKDVVSSFSANLAMNGTGSCHMGKEKVKLFMTIRARAKYEYSIWPSSERVLDVKCSDLDVVFDAKSEHTTCELRVIDKDCHVEVKYPH